MSLKCPGEIKDGFDGAKCDYYFSIVNRNGGEFLECQNKDCTLYGRLFEFPEITLIPAVP